MWMKARPQWPCRDGEVGRAGVRRCRVQEEAGDMEILIHARGAGFAQGPSGCPVTAGPTSTQSLVAAWEGPAPALPSPEGPPASVCAQGVPLCSPRRRGTGWG